MVANRITRSQQRIYGDLVGKKGILNFSDRSLQFGDTFLKVG